MIYLLKYQHCILMCTVFRYPCDIGLFGAAERIVQSKLCAKRMRIQLLARTIDSQEEKVLLLLSTVLPLADKI